MVKVMRVAHVESVVVFERFVDQNRRFRRRGRRRRVRREPEKVFLGLLREVKSKKIMVAVAES